MHTKREKRFAGSQFLFCELQLFDIRICFESRYSDFGFRSSLVIVDWHGAAEVDWSMRLLRFSIILGLLVMAVCASSGQTPSVAESGIEGAITISPAKPGPIRADAPASKPLTNTTFVVENKNGEVTSFTTDDQGRFRVALPPGHYKVLLKGRKTSIGRFGPFEVDVAPGTMTSVQWECDSGIR